MHGQVGCYVREGHVYLISEDASSSTKFHIPRTLLPYSENLASEPGNGMSVSSRVIRNSYSNTEGFSTVGVFTPNDAYGAAAISIRHCHAGQESESPSSTFIRFRPADDHGSSQTLDNSDFINLPGKIQISKCGLYMTNTGHSGTSLISIMNTDERLSLCLVRYIRDTRAISVHELQLPPYIDLGRMQGVGLDDYRGTVFLTSDSGVLFSIPYANM